MILKVFLLLLLLYQLNLLKIIYKCYILHLKAYLNQIYDLRVENLFKLIKGSENKKSFLNIKFYL